MKRLALGFLLFTMLLLGAALIPNLIDDAPDERVSKILGTADKKPSRNHLDAYKFSLGFGADENDDPLKKGEKLYLANKNKQPSSEIELLKAARRFNFRERCQKNSNCKAEEMASAKTAILENSKVMYLGMARYEKLLSFGGMGFDLIPSLEVLVYPSITFFYLSNNMFIELNESWNHGSRVQTIERLLKQRDFYLNSIQYEHSLLFYSIALNIISDSQQFLRARQLELKSKVFDQLRERFEVSVDFSKLKTLALRSEFKVVASSMQMLQRDPLGMFYEDFAPKWLWGPANKVLLSPNATLNRYYRHVIGSLSEECIEANSCKTEVHRLSFWDYVYNPIGKTLVAVMQTNVGSALHKMLLKVKNINKAT